jgi:hypothetical protein
MITNLRLPNTSSLNRGDLDWRGGNAHVAIDVSALNEMQTRYKAAVEEWVAAIRQEEALASGNHSTAEVDSWEAAGFREEDARNKAKAAKSEYEAALREEFFHF